jgi:hypothetical protein
MTARIPASTLHHHLAESQRPQDRPVLCHTADTKRVIETKQGGAQSAPNAHVALARAEQAW